MLQLGRCYLHLSLLVSLAVSLSVSREGSGCVTYGDCGGLPCVASTTPRSLGEEGQRVLEELCPHLKASDGFCCDDEQTKIFKSKIGKADGLLGGCPTAITNFRSLVCEVTCSPNQVEFVEVVEKKPYEGRVKATTLRYHLSKEYSDKVWMSTRKKSKLLCGNLFSECSKAELFKFLGDNHWTSLKTEYLIKERAEPGFHHAPDDHMKCVQERSGVCQC